MTSLAHVSSGRVIEGNTTTYLAVPGGRTHDGERLWWVPCVTCRGQYSLRPRTLRDLIKSGRDPVCSFCRMGVRVKITRWHLRYWLNRYSLAELLEIAETAYGPIETWRTPSEGEKERALALEVLSDFPYQAREAALAAGKAA